MDRDCVTALEVDYETQSDRGFELGTDCVMASEVGCETQSDRIST